MTSEQRRRMQLGKQLEILVEMLLRWWKQQYKCSEDSFFFRMISRKYCLFTLKGKFTQPFKGRQKQVILCEFSRYLGIKWRKSSEKMNLSYKNNLFKTCRTTIIFSIFTLFSWFSLTESKIMWSVFPVGNMQFSCEILAYGRTWKWLYFFILAEVWVL